MFDQKMLSNKLMNRFFRPVDNVMWDIMSGKIGINTSEGIVSVEGAGDEAQVIVNPLDQFGFPVPAFAQSTPVDSIQIGDLIFGAKKELGWVVEKKEKSFVLLKSDGTRSTWSPPKVQMLGFDSGAMVLRSLINVLPGGASGLGQMQSMMMPLMMMGGDNDALADMIPMMLMAQCGFGGTSDGTAANSNNMGNIMQMMMMAKMMSGDKMKSPFGGRSGGSHFDR